jgi:hypothetical protein
LTGPIRSDRWYTLYGRPVRSDVPLPIGPSPRPALSRPGWTFERRTTTRGAPPPDGPPVATLRGQDGATIAVRHQAPDGIWIRHPAIGACHIAPRQRRVTIYARSGIDESILGLLLASQVAVVLLHELGHVTLNASAVALPQGAIAFLGSPGQGKSTLAASFLERGAELVTDDVLPLQSADGGVLALPGLPAMKLWPQTIHGRLEIDRAPPPISSDDQDRPLPRDGHRPFRTEPVPLRGIFVLDRYDADERGRVDVTLCRLAARDGLTAMLGHAACAALLPPEEVARLLPRYAGVAARVPIRVLSYPSGLEHRDAVHAAVAAELRLDLQEGSAYPRSVAAGRHLAGFDVLTHAAPAAEDAGRETGGREDGRSPRSILPSGGPGGSGRPALT